MQKKYKTMNEVNRVTEQDLDTTLRVLSWVLKRTKSRKASFYTMYKLNGYENDYNDYKYWEAKERELKSIITHVQENRYLYINNKE